MPLKTSRLESGLDYCVTLVHFIKCKSTFSYYKVDIYICFNKAINAHEIGLSSSKKNVGQSTRSGLMVLKEARDLGFL